MSRNSLLMRVRQVASPRKSAMARLERVQKINKVSKSLFGPVIKSEFRRFAQMEMTKYQLQASYKWSFDFAKESPIAHVNSQLKWEPTSLSNIPKFYHHTTHSMGLSSHYQPITALESSNRHVQMFTGCENICPLMQNISEPSIILQNPLSVSKRKTVASTSFATKKVCGSQRKITGKSINTFQK
ncbi:CLUMA_CG011641, isoform A [Clunio marinus]|uniref:CLUMA_CG011641, isoform A n=1 Tax=Clunio marinus TaxID=568069 RepID=A0A1J1IDB5_9DIPT|nr:CLUMA_CG011641, isoform A [Clunio marinus]